MFPNIHKRHRMVNKISQADPPEQRGFPSHRARQRLMFVPISDHEVRFPQSLDTS